MARGDSAALRAWLVVTLLYLAPEYRGAVTDDTPLVEGGIGLDSLALVDLVAALDDDLGVRVAESEITEAHFGTVGRVLSFLESRRA